MSNVLIVPFFNCDQYIARCVESIKKQVGDFKCFMIDDCSKDASRYRVMESCMKDTRFELVIRDEKFWQTMNHYDIIHNRCDNDDIVFSIDGDDQLSDSFVVERISNLYKDNPNTWLTYGSYKYSNNKPGIAQAIVDCSTVRKDIWKGTHLKTWKAGLFKKIKLKDLLDEKGKFQPQTGDMNMMFPMLEMAGDKHCVYCPEINYIYNEHNPLSDHMKDRKGQYKAELFIRSKPPYEAIETL